MGFILHSLLPVHVTINTTDYYVNKLLTKLFTLRPHVPLDLFITTVQCLANFTNRYTHLYHRGYSLKSQARFLMGISGPWTAFSCSHNLIMNMAQFVKCISLSHERFFPVFSVDSDILMAFSSFLGGSHLSNY